jgi:hypothetical protein
MARLGERDGCSLASTGLFRPIDGGIVSEASDLTFLDFIDDTLTTILTIGSAVGVAMLGQCMPSTRSHLVTNL